MDVCKSDAWQKCSIRAPTKYIFTFYCALFWFFFRCVSCVCVCVLLLLSCHLSYILYSVSNFILFFLPLSDIPFIVCILCAVYPPTFTGVRNTSIHCTNWLGTCIGKWLCALNFWANVICAIFFLSFFSNNYVVQFLKSILEFVFIALQPIHSPYDLLFKCICICTHCTTKYHKTNMELVVYSCPRCLPCTNKCARLFVSHFSIVRLRIACRHFSIADCGYLQFVTPCSFWRSSVVRIGFIFFSRSFPYYFFFIRCSFLAHSI